jgi:hypothetical protein
MSVPPPHSLGRLLTKRSRPPRSGVGPKSLEAEFTGSGRSIPDSGPLNGVLDRVLIDNTGILAAVILPTELNEEVMGLCSPIGRCR